MGYGTGETIAIRLDMDIVVFWETFAIHLDMDIVVFWDPKPTDYWE